MPPAEKRIVELSNPDRHLLTRIANALDKQARVPNESEREKRLALFQQFFGQPLPDIPPEYPHKVGDYTVLGPELFNNAENTVISYKGETFYRSCDAFVKDLDDGGQSHCVKRVGHPRPNEHEDYNGNITTGFAG